MTRLAGSSGGNVSLLGRDLLLRHRRISMVGLSANPSRPSYRAAVHMLAYGFEVIPVNPTVTEVLGQRSYPTLADVPGCPGLVDVFRRVEEIPGTVRAAIAAGAAAIWLQLGLVSDEARALADAAGIPYIEDRCVKMEHCRWFGGLNWVGLSTGVISARREEVQRAGRA